MMPELLHLLPPEVAQSLGPWIDRLALALGPLRARVRHGEGAPDGYDGLAPRGPFERLSVSDWALAEVVPDEFVRRAAMHELLFYQLARREEARARTSVALFDPGPMQLGAPRIAQFACLLALHDRAASAGARFGWSTLQRPPQGGEGQPPLRGAVDPLALRTFLLGRMAFAPTAEDIAAWLDHARVGGWEDLWIVGPPDTIPPGRRLTGVSTPVGRIEIEEAPEPAVRALDVTVVRGAVRRTLRLPLPPESVCVRLLREGLPTTPAAPAPPPAPAPSATALLRPTGPVLLLADGRKLAWVDARHQVNVLNVPDAPEARRPSYRRHPSVEGAVIALGWIAHRLVRITADAGAMRLEDLPPQRLPSGGLRVALAPPDGGPLVQAFVCPDPSHPALTAVTFLDAAGRLVVLSTRGEGHTQDDVLALREVQEIQGLVPHVARAGGTEPTPLRGVRVHRVRPDARRVLLGAARGGRVVVAHERDEAWWLPEPQHDDVRVAVPVGAEVLGVTGVAGSPERSALLVLLADRLTLVAWSAEGPMPRLTLPCVALSATATVRGDRAAFVHDDHSVTVWSLPTGRCLLRYGCRP